VLPNMPHTRAAYLEALTVNGFDLMKILDLPLRDLPPRDYPPPFTEEKTVERISRTPEFVRSVATDRGIITFRSTTTLNHAEHQMHICESHHLRSHEGESEQTYEFVMRCWTLAEVQQQLHAAQFHIVQHWGAYDEQTPLGMTDRIITCAHL
jgi:hypothetical protein